MDYWFPKKTQFVSLDDMQKKAAGLDPAAWRQPFTREYHQRRMESYRTVKKLTTEARQQYLANYNPTRQVMSDHNPKPAPIPPITVDAAQLVQFTTEYNHAVEAEKAARDAASAALSKLNSAQAAFDDFVTKLRAAAPTGSVWRPPNT